MFDPDSKDPPRSLLSLSRAGRSARAARDEREDAAARHRLARSRRDASPSPLMAALAAAEARQDRAGPTDTAAAETSEHDSAVSRLGRLFPRRRRPANDEGQTASPPPSPAAAEVRAEESVTLARPAAPQPAGDDLYWRPLIDPARIFQGIYRSRHIILATTALGAVLGIAIALNTPKKYESVAELLVDPRNLRIVDSELTQSGLSAEATLAVVENQVRVITSGAVLNKVVDKLNLEADPEFNGQAGSGFSPGALIAELRSIFSRSDRAEGSVRQRALAIENLAKSLEVERGGKTFVVSVGATTEDAEKSALIANTVTDVFLETYGGIQSGTAGRASDELTSRLSQLQAEVEEAERKVEAYKAENDLVDAQGRLISDDEMVKLNEQLSIARARTIELNARAASARDLGVDEVVNGALPEQVASPVLAQLRSQYATLKQEADRLAVRLGPRHPQRLDAEAQLAGARDGLQAELRRVTSSIQVELKRAVQLEQDLAARLAQLKVRQSNVSDDLVTLRELEREAAAKRTIYESFLLRARETGEQSGFNTANVNVISKAQPPLEPLGPSRSMMVIAATAIGFVAGVGIGALRGAVDSLREGGTRAPRAPAARPALMSRREPDAEDGTAVVRPSRMSGAAPEPRRDTPAGGAPRQTPPSRESRPTEPRSEDQQMYPAYPSYVHAPAYPQTQTAYPQTQTAYPHPHAGYPQPHAGYPQPHGQPGYAGMSQPQPWPAQPAPASYLQDPQAAAWAQQQAMQQAWAAQNAYARHPQAWGWQAAPVPPAPPSYAAAHPAPYPAPAMHPAERPYPPEEPRRERSAVDEIRDSLREFREAVRDLTDRRSGARDW